MKIKRAGSFRHSGNFLDATLTVEDDRELLVSLSPAAQSALMNHLLARIPGSTATAKLAIKATGIAVGMQVETGEALIEIFMPGDLSVAVLIPPQGIEQFQRKVAAIPSPTSR